MAEQAFRIVVFSFEIAADIGLEEMGLAQHLLPVRILEPSVVVRHGDAMAGERMRPARRERGCQRRFDFGSLRHAILVLAKGWFCHIYIGANVPVARCALVPRTQRSTCDALLIRGPCG